MIFKLKRPQPDVLCPPVIDFQKREREREKKKQVKIGQLKKKFYHVKTFKSNSG